MEISVPALVTLLHLADGHTFGDTARHLGLSQPTVSAQLAGLERAAGETLLVRRRGRGGDVSLTAAGRELVALARPLVAAHGRVADHLDRDRVTGVARLAIADDIASHSGVGDALRTFRRRHPTAQVEITVGQSSLLLRRLRAGQFDLALAKRLSTDDEGAVTVLRRERLCWAVHRDLREVPALPLPLLVYPIHSPFRRRAIERLDAIGVPWRIANNVRGVNGAITATRAGLGIGVFAESMLPPDIASAPPEWGLPDLGTVDSVIAAATHLGGSSAALLETLEAWGLELFSGQLGSVP